jgi:hypothetical protein
MITHPIYGGLGNQLFQIFAVIALSLKTGHPFFFKYRTLIDDQDTHRHTYWNTLLAKLRPYTVDMDVADDVDSVVPRPGFLSWPKVEIAEPHHEYFEMVPGLIPPLAVIREFVDEPHEVVYELGGFFQSYKYFEAEFVQICETIGVREHQAAIRAEVGTEVAPIAMHFRRGDYKGLQHIHPILPFEYYRNSLTLVLEKLGPGAVPEEPGSGTGTVAVTLFCEKEDMTDIYEGVVLRLIPLFPKCSFHFAPMDMVEWKHMLLMSLSRCIITGNSTFSLWAAMLCPHPDPIVCYTWYWFTELFGRNVKDMFPPRWYKVGHIVCEKDGEKSQHKVY